MGLFLLLLGSLLSSDPPSEVPTEFKVRLVQVINEDRRQAGLPPVEFSPELSHAADEHCREMVLEGYTSHWNRAGWKPYLRYAAVGIRGLTAENISGLWETSFPSDAERVWANMLAAHRSFLSEQPPHDGHRRSVLGANHTHVGVGVAFNQRGMRLIEVFSAQYAELDPLPLRATLRDNLAVRGLLQRGLELLSISVYYEPLPRPMTLEQLRGTSSYGLPAVAHTELPKLYGRRIYLDGTRGTIDIDPSGRRFSVPLRFWKGKPGVYTVAVWVRRKSGEPFIGALTPVLVEESGRRSSILLPRVPRAPARLPIACASLP